MDFDALGRRDFLAGSGGLFLCTLAGQKLPLDEQADVEKLAAELEAPPKVAEAGRAGDSSGEAVLAAQGDATPEQRAAAPRAISGAREYWIKAEPRRWNPVPTGRDQMMNKKVRGRKFMAFGYRRYTAGFGAPIGPATIPGPLIEAEVGETVIVNFQNLLPSPVTMHPHGIFYTADMDGAYKGKFTDPGGFVQRGKTFRYVWEATPGTEGAWLYHDHGPLDPLPLYRGLFGPLIVRPEGAPRPDREFFLFLHDLTPVATGGSRVYSCVNGRAYAGNTPTLRTRVGEKVAMYVYGIDNNFHTFHLHGHRWTDPNGGQVVDNVTLGPGDVITVPFVEDNPGRWFYHCHVFSHLHAGMNGWYLVDP